MKRYVKGLSILILSLTLLGCEDTSKVEKELYNIENNTEVISKGKIQPKETQVINLESYVNANIEYKFTEGQVVEAGSIIFRVEDITIESQISANKLNLEKINKEINSTREKINDITKKIDEITNKIKGYEGKEQTIYNIEGIEVKNSINENMQLELEQSKEELKALELSNKTNIESKSEIAQNIDSLSQNKYKDIKSSISGSIYFNKGENSIIIYGKDMVVRTQISEYDYDLIEVNQVLSIKDIFRNKILDGKVISKSNRAMDYTSEISQYEMIIDIEDKVVDGTTVEVVQGNDKLNLPKESIYIKNEQYYVFLVDEKKETLHKVKGEFKGNEFEVSEDYKSLINKQILRYANEGIVDDKVE